MKKYFTKAVFSVCLLGSTIPMHAAIISGTLNFAGDVRVSQSTIDFLPVGGGNGITTMTIGATAQTGSFAGLQGTTATILDLNSATSPPGTTLNVPGFVSGFTGFPGLNFTLTQILLGTLPGTPFSLTQTAGGTTVVFSVTGTVKDASASPASSFIGTFSSNFPGLTAAQVLGQIGTNGFVQDSFAATFIATPPSSVPEPGTAMSLICGTLLVGAGFRFRSKKA